MTRRPRTLPRAAAAATAALLALALWLLPGTASAEPRPTVLQLATPEVATVGDVMELHALLFEREGGPVAGARITLYERLGYMTVIEREVAVESAITGDDGVAIFRHVLRRDGTRAFSIRFEGDSRHAAVETSFELPVAAGAQVQIVRPSAGIPGVSNWLLIVVVGAVWGALFWATLQIATLARESSRRDVADGQARSAGWLMSRWGLPVTFMGTVAVIGMTLVVVLGRSPNTRANLFEAQSGYTRTYVPPLGEEPVFDGFATKIGDPPYARSVGAQVEPEAIYIRAGCAGCHGLEGRGGAVAGAIWDTDYEHMLRAVREGWPGMPVFPPTWLSDEQVELMTRYLNGLQREQAAR